MRTLVEIREQVLKAKGRREDLQKEKRSLGFNLESLKESRDASKKALILLQDVAAKTQEQLRVSVETAVQHCIDVLFPGYTFAVHFVPRRGKTEADFRIYRGGAELDPMASSGGGVVDAISFSLRTGCLQLAGKRPLLILDEPFKYVRGEPRQELGRVLELLVKTLNVQVIMVSDVAGTAMSAETEYSF